MPSCAAEAPAASTAAMPGAGHDRAGGDQRDVDGGADQLQRGEQREVGRGLVVVEDAAVPAGLDALDDQRVGAARDGLRAPPRAR